MSPPLDSDSYVATFGGENRSPAQIDYVSYTTAVDLHLQWPFLAEDGAFIAPAKLDITATAANLKIYMPDASIASVGQDCLIRNIGSTAFTIVDFDGNTLVNITSGLQWLVWIVNDDTPAGQWAQVQFGAGVSNANAGALAGAGLRAEVTRLDQHLVSSELMGGYAIGQGDRARVLQSNGGVTVWTVASAAALGNGWFTYVVNRGTGNLTIDPFGGETIDGSGTKIYAPGESSMIFSDGTELVTLGYGRSLTSTVTGTSINLAPGGTITLTPTQLAAQVQNWTGTLTANAILEYGGGVGYWFVWNNTTGAFSVQARTNSLDPGAVISQGTFSILRSDGANLDIAFSATTGTVTSVGTVAGQTTGGPITTTGTIGLADTAVVPGSYGGGSPPYYPIFSVDQKGRLTSATSVPLGTGAFINFGNGVGQVPVIGADGNLPSAVGAVPTGAIFDYMLATIPAGYVWAVGTIGNTGSGANNRANTDTHNLFVGIWNSYPDSTAPVGPGGRGASAEADWGANKVITITDFRGRARVGRDAMGPFGGADRMTVQASPNGITMGASGGVQQTTVGVGVSVSGSIGGNTTGTLPVAASGSGTTDGASSFVNVSSLGGVQAAQEHTHSFSVNVAGSTVAGHSLGITGTFSGSGSGNTATIPTMVPFAICNVIVKL